MFNLLLKSSYALGILTLACIPLLSGCATSYTITKSKSGTAIQTHVHFSDHITHIGMPKSQLKDFPYALVALGEKQSYLITSGDENNPSVLYDIFNQVDIHYLYLEPRLFLDSKINTTRSENIFKTSITDDCYKQNKLCNTMRLYFQKPTDELANNEISKLNKLGFTCQALAKTHKSQELLQCQRLIEVNTHINQKINTQANAYQLKQPITFQIIEEEPKRVDRKGIALLTPLAVVVDIVTLPVQMLLFMGLMHQYSKD